MASFHDDCFAYTLCSKVLMLLKKENLILFTLSLSLSIVRGSCQLISCCSAACHHGKNNLASPIIQLDSFMNSKARFFHQFKALLCVVNAIRASAGSKLAMEASTKKPRSKKASRKSSPPPPPSSRKRPCKRTAPSPAPPTPPTTQKPSQSKNPPPVRHIPLAFICTKILLLKLHLRLALCSSTHPSLFSLYQQYTALHADILGANITRSFGKFPLPFL